MGDYQKLIILVGNLGAGKSTLAKKLFEENSDSTIVVNMDSLHKSMAAGIYTAYDDNKKPVYHAAENAMIKEALELRYDVIIDRTNMDLKRRKRFIEFGKQFKCEIICYNFGIGSEMELQRRLNEPKGVPIETWRAVYNLFKKAYVEPTKEEGFDTIIKKG